MKQAWGWLMAGVVAAGLNASYHDGGFQFVHQAAERAGHNVQAVLALASGRADQFLTEARIVQAQNQTASCQFATALARVQSRVDRTQARVYRFEAMSDREQARLDHFEAMRTRVENRVARIRIASPVVEPMVFVTAPTASVCPRVRVSVPRIPAVKVPTISMPEIPQVHVEVSTFGTI
jgi:hypothetical protein